MTDPRLAPGMAMRSCACLCHESGPPDEHMATGQKCPCGGRGRARRTDRPRGPVPPVLEGHPVTSDHEQAATALREAAADLACSIDGGLRQRVEELLTTYRQLPSDRAGHRLAAALRDALDFDLSTGGNP